MLRILLLLIALGISPLLRAQYSLAQLAQSEQKAFMHVHKAERSAVSNYNITYTRLELKADPAVNYITGCVTMCFIPDADLNSLELDLSDSLGIDSIVYNNAVLPYTHSADLLNVSFNASLSQGVVDSLKIYYQGKPAGGNGFGSFVQGLHDSVPVIWTLSEPYGAKDWWPCKQNLNDKIDSLDVVVTVPEPYKVASNGLLVEELHNNSSVTYRWKHRYPIATYLVCFAVTNYEVYNNYVPRGNDSLPVVNYVYPEHAEDARNATPNVVAMIQLYDSLFGLYPFDNEKYGMAEFGWGGGMEHQTMTFMTNFGFELMAHELGHHWFGDKVTCGSWHDIWLNEGFATYLSILCYQHLAPEYYRASKLGTRNNASIDPSGSVWCDDTTNVSRIFSGHLTYSKGAMVLHMLRFTLGDSIFFKAARNYLADNSLAYSYATTADFKRHIEEASGKNLSLFFNQWVYGSGYPSYTINWQQDFTNHVIINIQQTTSDPTSVSFFEMNVPVRIYGAGVDTNLILPNIFYGQTYELDLPFSADSLVFDPDIWLLSKDNNVVRNAAYSFSFNIYPNPVSNLLHVRVETEQIAEAMIKIINKTGQTVLKQKETLNAGSNTLDINTATLMAGSYSFIIEANSHIYSKGFIKVR